MLEVFTLLVLLGSANLPAQDGEGSADRQGFWIGFGVAATQGYIDCSPCEPLLPNDPWAGGGGFGLYVALGGTVRSNLLLGGELNLYGKRNSALQRDATLGALSGVVQLYPLPGSGLYVKAGAGLGGSIMAGGDGLIESGGWAAQAGAAYDLRLRRRFALAPFANFVQVLSAGAEGRNQGIPVRGPRNPRYLQFGVGFHWY